MPKKLYVMYHEQEKKLDSWYEAQESVQNFSEEGPVALYEISGKKKYLKILNVLDTKKEQ